MRLLIAAGGTGGHLFPGIAIASFLQRKDPTAQCLFVGSGSPVEEAILDRSGLMHRSLRVGRLKGQGMISKLRTLLTLPLSLIQAWKILAQWKPDCVLGIGGYSSGPMILAAWMKRIPRSILEPNAIPGLTNKILARFADRIFVAFPKAAEFFPKASTRMTGTPVREELSQIGASPLREGVKKKEMTLLVLGGSQGASSLNRAMTDLFPTLETSGKKFHLIHQTGSADFSATQKVYQEMSGSMKGSGTATSSFSDSVSYDVRPFIEDMASVFLGADLVISRAGASTLAELLATRSPSLLVPYPYAADDHQRWNAQAFVDVGGAEMIEDGELKNRLGERIFYYESHREELLKMRENLAGIQRVPATERVAEECMRLCTPR